jgi:hypothetical protein
MSLRVDDHATRVINRLAIFIAIVVAISLPVGYALTSLASASAALEFKAKVKASALNGLIANSPEIWMLAENRIQGLISREPVPLEDELVPLSRCCLISNSGCRPQPIPASEAATNACEDGRVCRGNSTWRRHMRRTQRD